MYVKTNTIKTIPYHAVPCSIVRHYNALLHILYTNTTTNTTPYHTIPYHTILYYTIIYHTIPCYTIL